MYYMKKYINKHIQDIYIQTYLSIHNASEGYSYAPCIEDIDFYISNILI